MEDFKNIIINSSRYYDYVIVDLKRGLRYKTQLEILDASDIIVLNTNQRISNIVDFFESKETQNLINKIIWNICRHDNNSKYNSKNITRAILKKQAVYEIPYNTLVHDASQEGNIVELLIRLKTLKEEDENLEFIRKVQELVQGILLKYQEIRSRK